VGHATSTTARWNHGVRPSVLRMTQVGGIWRAVAPHARRVAIEQSRLFWVFSVAVVIHILRIVSNTPRRLSASESAYRLPAGITTFLSKGLLKCREKVFVGGENLGRAMQRRRMRYVIPDKIVKSTQGSWVLSLVCLRG
jgi:hypothetical protein